jgi:hypothetical protein
MRPPLLRPVRVQVMLAQQRTITGLIETVNASQAAARRGAAELLRARQPPGRPDGNRLDAEVEEDAAAEGHRLERWAGVLGTWTRLPWRQCTP